MARGRATFSASTQNQALSALLFLYKDVLGIDIGPLGDVPRARLPVRVPVVLSREEVDRVLQQLTGTVWIIVVILYGAGLRITDCLSLRVKDIDFDRQQIVVRRGKGRKDVRTMLPVAVKERLKAHLEEVKRRHDRDLADGLGRAVLPFALDRKYPNASTEWGWQFVSRTICSVGVSCMPFVCRASNAHFRESYLRAVSCVRMLRLRVRRSTFGTGA